MKRSRIFLGATTCLLAVAGVAATKAAKFGSTKATYFTQKAIGGQHACILVTNQPCALVPNGIQCKYYTVGHHVTSFPLYTGISTTNGCTNQIQYLAN